MEAERIREILGDSRLLMAVDAATRAELAAIARPRRATRGETLLRPGEPSPGIFLVGSGTVRVYKLSDTGKEHVLHLASAGDSFAEVAVLGDFPSPAWAEALEDCELLLLPTAEIDGRLRAPGDFARQLLVGMAAWVRRLTGLLEDIVLRDALGRVASTLLERSDAEGLVELPAARRHLASHLNLTPETLSRCLRRLGDAGMVATKGDRLRVLDRARLQAAAGGMFPRL